MTLLISYRDLSVGRGDRILLRDLTGDVRAGEIVHLHGPNGIGKTSLLEVLGGLREPAAGVIERTVESDQCHWVGHRNALNPALSPAENLRFWCALQDLDEKLAVKGLRFFQLEAVADRPCRELSAGQRRRAALARLATAPRKLWLLDEPLSALDREGTQRWLALLGAHQQLGGAVVVTSHQTLPPPLAGLRVWELAA